MKRILIEIAVVAALLAALTSGHEAKAGCVLLGGGCNGIGAPACLTSPKIGTTFTFQFPACPAPSTASRMWLAAWAPFPPLPWQSTWLYGPCGDTWCSLAFAYHPQLGFAIYQVADFPTPSIGIVSSLLPNNAALVGANAVVAVICLNPDGEPSCVGASPSIQITFEA